MLMKIFYLFIINPTMHTMKHKPSKPPPRKDNKIGIKVTFFLGISVVLLALMMISLVLLLMM